MAHEFTHVSRQIYSINGMPQVYPEMTEEHVERTRLELRQQLSSVLNDPAHPMDVGWNPNDLVISRRADIPQVSTDDFRAYFEALRPQWNEFTSNHRGAEGDGDIDSDMVDFTDPDAASRYLGIPRVYFQENFVIHEPTTFREICGSSAEIATGNIMLQQRLSHFLDSVEVELVAQIGKRTEEFFQALTQIRELHSEVCKCVFQLQKVRRAVARTEEEVVTKSIAIPFLRRRRHAMDSLSQKMVQLQSVVGVEAKIESFLDQGDFSAALDLIFSSQELLQTELAGIVALKDVHQRLNEKVEQISFDMTDCLLNVTAEREFNQTAVEAIALPVFDGLLRFKKLKLGTVWESIWQQMNDQILTIVKEEQKEIDSIFGAFLDMLRKIKFLRELMMMVSSDHDSSAALDNQSQDTLQNICELQHTELAKLIAKFGITPDFVKVYKNTQNFVSASEEIAGKQCYSLRGCLMNQSKLYVDEFHNARLRKLSHLMDNEVWVQSQVAAGFSDIATAIFAEQPIEDLLSNSSPENSTQATIFLGDHAYCVVGSTLMFIRILSEYLRCLNDFPQLGADLSGRIARLLKMFNGRAAKLILGAEAMQGPAKLNRITAKHLALCSRSVALVGSLIVHVKYYLGETLTEKQKVLLKDFDTIAHEYELHVKDIERKLVAIMNDMCLSYVKQLRSADAVVEWGAFPNQTSSYIEGIASKTKKLHSVVAGVMPPGQLNSIFRRIFVMYKDRLCAAYDALELPSRAAGGRVLTDINYLCEQLHEMDGFDELLGTPLTDHWSERSLRS